MKKYDRAYRYLRPIMRGFMRELAARAQQFTDEKLEVFEETYEDFGYTLILPHDSEDDGSLDVSIRLIDSNEYDTGVPNKWGTIKFDAIYGSGQIIMDFAPFNYTDRVWAELDDLSELKSRLDIVIDGIDDIVAGLAEVM